MVAPKFQGYGMLYHAFLHARSRGLDEEGIRNDVRHGIRQGFGALLSTPLGLSPAESRRLLEIVADEARGKVIVGGTSDVLVVDQSVAALKHADSLGVSETLLSFDPKLQTEDEIYNTMKSIITSTNLGIVLYGAPNKAFRKFHPIGLPMNALNRLADLPNVIAVKLTQEINFVTAYQVAELVSDRVIVGAVNLEIVPLFANKYPVQWSGEWAVDAVQSPEKQYAVQFMDSVAKGRLGDAAKTYWAMQPALDAFFKLQGPTHRRRWTSVGSYQVLQMADRWKRRDTARLQTPAGSGAHIGCGSATNLQRRIPERRHQVRGSARRGFRGWKLQPMREVRG